MQNVCFTCLENLPFPVDEPQKDTHYNVESDENLIKILYMNTGLDKSNAENYPKKLCKKCYTKITAFDEFRDKAFCCATVLHELLLEKKFSNKTLNNLQHFCCTCLSKLPTQSNTSNQLKNVAWTRWLQEYIALKERTAVKQWPKNMCDTCCVRLNDFIELELSAKNIIKESEKDVIKAEINHGNEGATQKIENKKSESGINKISINNDNINKDDQRKAFQVKQNDDIEEGINQSASRNFLEYDINGTSNALEFTRKWVEKTAANAIRHYKNKSKQRSQRKRSRKTTLKSLRTSKCLSEVDFSVKDSPQIAFNEQQVETPNNFAMTENSATFDDEVVEKVTPNNKSTISNSSAQIQSQTKIGTIVEENKQKDLNDEDNDEKISEIELDKHTNSVEDASMSTISPLISNMPNNLTASVGSVKHISQILIPETTSMTFKNNLEYQQTIMSAYYNKSTNTVSCCVKVSEKSLLNNEASSPKSDALAENNSKIYSVVEEKEIEQRIRNSDTRISETENVICTNSEDVLMSPLTNNRISNVPAASIIMCETNNTNDSTVLKREYNDLLTSKNDIPNQEDENSSNNKSTENEPAESEMSHDPTADNACTIKKDIEVNSESKDAAISEVGIHNKKFSTTNLSKGSIKISSSVEATDSDLFIGAYRAIGQKRKHSDTRENTTVKQKKSSKQNISTVSNNQLTPKNPAKLDILIERPPDIKTPIENALLGSEESDTVKSEEVIPNPQVLIENISKVSNNEPGTEKLPDQDVKIEGPRDINTTHNKDKGIQKKNCNDKKSEYASQVCQTSSTKMMARKSKKKPKSKKPSNPATSAENPTVTVFMHVEDGGPNDEISNADISSDIISNQTNRTWNMANVLTKNPTSTKAPKKVKITEHSIDIDTMPVEGVGLNDERSDVEISEGTVNLPKPTRTIAKAPRKRLSQKILKIVSVGTEGPSDVALINEDEGHERGVAKNREDTINQISLTNNIAEETRNKSKWSSKLEVDNASLSGDKYHTNITDHAIIDEPNSTENIKKVQNMKSAGKVAESPTDIDFTHVEDGGLKVENLDTVTSADIILNQPVQENISKESNKPASKKKSKSVVPAESHSDVLLIIEDERREGYLDAEICKGDIPSQTSSRNSIANASSSKSKRTSKQDTSVKHLIDIGLRHVEDIGLNGEKSHSELTDEQKGLEKPDKLAQSPRYTDSTHMVDEGLKAENVDIISTDIIPTKPRQTKNKTKRSNKKGAAKKKSLPDISGKILTNIAATHVEDLALKRAMKPKESTESSSGEALLDGFLNQLDPANNIAEVSEQNSTETNPWIGDILAEMPTNIDTTHVQDVELKGGNSTTERRHLAEMPTNIDTTHVQDVELKGGNSTTESFSDDIDHLSSTSNTAKASKNKVASKHPAIGNLLVASPSDNDPTHTDNVGLNDEKFDAVTSFESSVNIASNNTPTEKYPELPNISTETDMDFNHVQNLELKEKGNNAVISATTIKAQSKRQLRRDTLVENPLEIDAAHAYDLGLKAKSSINVLNEEMIINKSTKSDTSANNPKEIEANVEKVGLEDMGLKVEISDDQASKDITFQTSSAKNVAKSSKTEVTSIASNRSTSDKCLGTVDSTHVPKPGSKDESSDTNISAKDFRKQKNYTYTTLFKTDNTSTSVQPEKTGTMHTGYPIVGINKNKNDATVSKTVVLHQPWKDDITYNKSTSKEPERSKFSTETPNQLERSTKNISQGSHKKSSNKPPKPDILFKSHSATNTTFTSFEGQKEKNRYTKATGDSFSHEKKSTTNSAMTSSYHKWSNKPARSDIFVAAPTAIDSNFTADPSYYRRDPVSSTSKFRNPNSSRHMNHTYETHEMYPTTFAPYSIPNYYQCLVCMQTFKRREHLSKHRRFSLRCSRII
ncbi:uncharacterized protein [Eurosta solidaginis]|uniref:uncharacterized protein isoform X2 n=1 Tax=Eurosta solidaginis TaxID=178769 RepID=UPI003531193E